MAGGTSISGVAAPDPIVFASAAVDVLLVVVGLSVRSGRGWIASVNVVAVIVFLYGTAALGSGLSEVPLVFAILYGVVFVAIFLNRAWFDAMRTWREPAAVHPPG